MSFKKAMLLILALVFIIPGIYSFFISLQMPSLDSNNEFLRQYLQIHDLENGLRSPIYDEVRRSFNIDKYVYEDYGLTVATLGLIPLFLFFVNFRKLTISKKNGGILIYAFISIFLMMANGFGLFFDLYDRYYIPYWESNYYFIFGIPIVLLLMSLWLMIGSFSLPQGYTFQKELKVFPVFAHKVRPKYWLNLLVCICLIIVAVYFGQYPAVLSLYFAFYYFLCLAKKMSVLEFSFSQKSIY